MSRNILCGAVLLFLISFVSAANPIGVLGGADSAYVYGWACDTDSNSTSISVHLFFDGPYSPDSNKYKYFAVTTANLDSPDVTVAGVCGGVGSHRFRYAIPQSVLDLLGPGRHSVYAYGINVGEGANTLLNYSYNYFNIPGTTINHNPIGNLGMIDSNSIYGWACDTDSNSTSISVHLFFDGPYSSSSDSMTKYFDDYKYFAAVTANLDSPDVTVAGVCGGVGSHRFRYAIPQSVLDLLGPGRHSVYAYGINVGAGSNTILYNSPKYFDIIDTNGTLSLISAQGIDDEALSLVSEQEIMSHASIQALSIDYANIDAGINTYTDGHTRYWVWPTIVRTSDLNDFEVYHVTTTNNITTGLDNPLGDSHSFLGPEGNFFSDLTSIGRLWLVGTYEINEGEIIGFFHVEHADGTSSQVYTIPNYTGRGRIAVAYFKKETNNNKWRYMGYIISPKGDPENWNIQGAPYIIKDEYIYLYYSEPGLYTAVARTKLADLISSAQSGALSPPWYKYYNGQWISEALGGEFTPLNNLSRASVTPGGAAQSTYNNKYYMARTTQIKNILTFSTAIEVYESDDGINWTKKASLLERKTLDYPTALVGWQYLSLVSSDDSQWSNGEIGKSFYIYVGWEPATSNVVWKRLFVDITGPPICTSFTYSIWGDCSPSGIQSRQVLTTTPISCQGGNPIITQTCNYNPNTNNGSKHGGGSNYNNILDSNKKPDTNNNINPGEEDSGCASDTECNLDEACSQQICTQLNCKSNYAVNNHACVCLETPCGGECKAGAGICCNSIWNEGLTSCAYSIESGKINTITLSKDSEAINILANANLLIESGDIIEGKRTASLAEAKAQIILAGEPYLLLSKFEEAKLALTQKDYNKFDLLILELTKPPLIVTSKNDLLLAVCLVIAGTLLSLLIILLLKIRREKPQQIRPLEENPIGAGLDEEKQVQEIKDNLSAEPKKD